MVKNIMIAIKNIDRYKNYLRDESYYHGNADGILFPETDKQLIEIIEELYKRGKTITLQGARTGITGATCPSNGYIVNTEKLNKINGISCTNGKVLINVQSGVRLEEISRFLGTAEAKAQFNDIGRYFFAPDPTESLATAGGAFSTNAGGISKYKYGKTAKYVEHIGIVTPVFGKIDIERGSFVWDEYGCDFAQFGKLEMKVDTVSSGKPLVPYVGMDMIDLFAGSEGMLGAITEITFKLCIRPDVQWGLVFFFEDEMNAIKFGKNILEFKWNEVSVASIEFFDENTLKLIGEYKKDVTKLRIIPDFPKNAISAIFIQLDSSNEEKIEAALMELLEMFEKMGGSEKDAWAANGKDEIERFKLLRHAAPESANIKTEHILGKYEAARKMAMDFSTPPAYRERILEKYRVDLNASGIEGIIFGHFADSHFHVNLFPKNRIEAEKAKKITDVWVGKVIEVGGNVISENGVGKIKKNIYKKYLTDKEYASAVAVKRFFDPNMLLNTGNMFL